MICNCVNIYPDEDLKKWSVCQSFDILENYYTKGEVDAKIADIQVDVDLSNYYTKGETNTLLDNKLDASAYTPTDLSNYISKRQIEWIKETDSEKSIPLWTDNYRDRGIRFTGDIRATVSQIGIGKWVSMTCMLPIKGDVSMGTDSLGGESVNGLLGRYQVEIGKWNDYEDNIQGEYSSDYGQTYWNASPYLVVGSGFDDNRRRNLFTMYDNGFVKMKSLFEEDIILQEWMENIQDNYSSKQWVNDNYMPWSESDYIWNSDRGINSKQPMLVSGTNIKTINGQSLIGEGNITISGGGSADLSNYYNKQEVDNKLDLKANASDLSALNTTVGQLSTTVENKADASNVYTKTEVNNLVNNKFWCGTQSQYDALTNKENDVLYLIY